MWKTKKSVRSLKPPEEDDELEEEEEEEEEEEDCPERTKLQAQSKPLLVTWFHVQLIPSLLQRGGFLSLSEWIVGTPILQ